MTKTQQTTAPAGQSGWLPELRSSLRERREARASRGTLYAELSSYRTPTEVNDLFAALRTEDDSQIAEDMRAILSANLETHRRRTAP
jgi:hypothetical protein